METFNLKKIIKERVDKESWVEYSKTPNQPLKKMKFKKTNHNLLWWINFSKNLVKELNP